MTPRPGPSGCNMPHQKATRLSSESLRWALYPHLPAGGQRAGAFVCPVEKPQTSRAVPSVVQAHWATWAEAVNEPVPSGPNRMAARCAACVHPSGLCCWGCAASGCEPAVTDLVGQLGDRALEPPGVMTACLRAQCPSVPSQCWGTGKKRGSVSKGGTTKMP